MLLPVQQAQQRVSWQPERLPECCIGVKQSDLSEEQKQTISTLATVSAGLAGGLTGNSTASAAVGAQSGKNAVENNYLSNKQIDARSAEMKSCQAKGGDCGGIIKSTKS